MKTAKEIAQWVIDNRYSKSENEKVSDVEMYHELVESIDNMCSMTNLSGSALNKAIKLLDRMNADERTDIFAKYCTYCGDKDPSCQCWNDE